jgi:sugar transferase (PEP-CTERM/EpsH1 system associated)
MRILWVKIGGLWPLNTGGRLRSFHTIAELARRHRVTVLTTHDPADDPTPLGTRLADCERVVSIPYVVPGHDSARFALALVRSWFSPLPVDIWRCRVPPLRKAVARHLAGGEVDLCVADYLAAAPNVAMNGRIPSILFTHNVEHMIWKRLCQVETRAWRRALLEVEWQKLRRYEAQACARAHRTVAVSEADRAMLAEHAPRARVDAVPTGVDTTYFQPDGSHETPGSLVFFGSMDWFPNEDGIAHFVEAILPRIRARMPEVSVTVAGRKPPARVRRLAAVPGVRVTGTVEDVRPYVAEAAVCVVPLRVGGGTRLKIFEALAMGKAVVSTSVGAEGLPMIPGQHFLQADDPAAFADATSGLLQDPGRRRALGAAGRRLVEERYSWPQVAREFETICEDVVNHAR